MADPPNVTFSKSPEEGLRPRQNDTSIMQKSKPQPGAGLLPKLLNGWYGMVENPFGVTPNPRYLYESKTHAEARSALFFGIESGIGFQALIAPPGMGKTTILFQLLEQFRDVARTGFLYQIHGDSKDFLQYLLSELGSDATDSSAAGQQAAINQLLAREFRSGRRVIIVIDEAQSLETPVLETIRLLSNFETKSQKLLQIILSGQPQLVQRLANPDLAQLYQRISILTTLIPFELEDTKYYIEHRLKISGYQGPPLFASAALRLIWEYSGGIPRKINTLCFNALLLLRAVEQKQVDSDILHEVLEDLDLDRIRFNTGVRGSSLRVSRCAYELRSGNEAEDDSLGSCVEKIRRAEVSGAEPELDNTSTRSAMVDGADLAQLEEKAIGKISTNRAEEAAQADISEAGLKSNDVDLAFPPAQPILAIHRGTNAQTLANTRPFGASLWDSEVAFNARDVLPCVGEAISRGLHRKWHFGSVKGRSIFVIVFVSILSWTVLHKAGLGSQSIPHPSRHKTEPSHVAAPVVLAWKPEAERDVPRSNVARVAHVIKFTSAIGLQNATRNIVTPDASVSAPSTNEVSEIAASSAAASGIKSLFSTAPAMPVLSAPISQGVTGGILQHKVPPVYPPEARRVRIEGNVVLQAIITAQGRLEDLKVISGHPLLVQAAEDAVNQWRYTPYLLNGEPIPEEIRITITFKAAQ
jgi:general secretion pathway protein A